MAVTYKLQKSDNVGNISATLKIKKGEGVTILNDNNPNGLEGRSYILVFNQGSTGYQNPTMAATGTPAVGDEWKLNPLTAAHEMDFNVSYGDKTPHVLDSEYNVYWQVGGSV